MLRDASLSTFGSEKLFKKLGCWTYSSEVSALHY